MRECSDFIQHEKKLFGFYRGKVLKHLPFGKCKIYIYGVYDPSLLDTPDYIPDAEQAAPLFGGSNNGNGSFSYPNINATVWCFFANGDQNMPVYFASTLAGDNAFGQYEKIMPPRYRYDHLKDSNKEQYEEEKEREESKHSDKHLITSGNTQIQLHESGKLSVIVRNPYQLHAKVDHNDTFQYESQYDHTTDYPVEYKVEMDQISSIHCKVVVDNEVNNGEIFSSTYQYNNKPTIVDKKFVSPEKIKSQVLSTQSNIVQNNIDNITLSTWTDKVRTINGKDQTTLISGETYVKIKSENDVEIIEYINDNVKNCKINNIKNSTKEILDQNINDTTKDSNNFSRIYQDKYGNIYIESAKSIVLKSKTISINAEEQLDINGKSILVKSDVNTTLSSAAVRIDTITGNTAIISRRGTTIL